MTSRLPVIAALAGCLALAAAQPGADAPPEKVFLLNVGKGQLPPDTGLDDKTRPEIIEDFKPLGGKALKIAFAPGDSFGARAGMNTNWKRFSLFRFDAHNPSENSVSLALTVVHSRSTNYQTRVVMPIRLKPGKNEVRIGLDEMTNVNGSAPNLASIVRWYILDADRKGPTVYFSDIWLEGAEAAQSVGVPAGPQALVGYKIKGTVGNLNVDLTITPFLAGAAPPKAAEV
ncbi:MAG TPA: hypothetical protein VKD72_16900, partial [Gemmataceae bacterium]|nr:hypothetical protein [Gemmataceae bacterium]